MKDFYLARVDEARSLDELNYIIEQAADELESNSSYEEVYQAAMDKIAVWREIIDKVSKDFN